MYEGWDMRPDDDVFTYRNDRCTAESNIPKVSGAAFLCVFFWYQLKMFAWIKKRKLIVIFFPTEFTIWIHFGIIRII